MTDAIEISALLRELAARWAVELSPRAEEKLVAYALELQRWNQRINLIRFANWRELVDRHLADGFAAMRHVPADASSLIDVGAGAGIPGAIIAGLRPELEVVALEPIHKKHAFLRSLRRSAALRNLVAYAARLEGDDEPEGIAGRFDVAISRATWAVPTWMEKARRLVRPGGVILALEGREATALPAGAQRHPYEADGRQRAVISLHRPAGAGTAQ
jgi:16S rRNA (guanine527-N7)-methyltransferase